MYSVIWPNAHISCHYLFFLQLSRVLTASTVCSATYNMTILCYQTLGVQFGKETICSYDLRYCCISAAAAHVKAVTMSYLLFIFTCFIVLTNFASSSGSVMVCNATRQTTKQTACLMELVERRSAVVAREHQCI
jgi:hypothetical protein